MDVQEAIMQMNLLDHNFFVFRDAETEEVNVSSIAATMAITASSSPVTEHRSL